MYAIVVLRYCLILHFLRLCTVRSSGPPRVTIWLRKHLERNTTSNPTTDDNNGKVPLGLCSSLVYIRRRSAISIAAYVRFGLEYTDELLRCKVSVNQKTNYIETSALRPFNLVFPAPCSQGLWVSRLALLSPSTGTRLSS